MSFLLKEPKVSIFNAKKLEDEAFYTRMYESVDAERRKKVERLRFPKDKRLSLAAGNLLKQGLLEIGIERYSLRYGENGKPYLDGENGVFFNLSHSGDFAVCAIFNKEVGVDIEKVGIASEKLLERVTTDSEYKYLMSLDEKKKNEEFFRLWSVKESYMKYLGAGFCLNPKDIEVGFGERLGISHNGTDVNVSLAECEVSGYKMTVCY